MKNQIMAWIGSAFLVATGAGVYFRNHIAIFLKCFKLTRDVVDLVQESIQDSADDKLTPEEVQKIINLFTQLKGDLKK